MARIVEKREMHKTLVEYFLSRAVVVFCLFVCGVGGGGVQIHKCPPFIFLCTCLPRTVIMPVLLRFILTDKSILILSCDFTKMVCTEWHSCKEVVELIMQDGSDLSSDFYASDENGGTIMHG